MLLIYHNILNYIPN